MRKIKRRPKTKPEASTLRRMVSQRELRTEIETLQHGVVRCTVLSSSVNKQSTVCEEDSYNNLTPSPLPLVTPFILLPSRTPIAPSSKSPNKKYIGFFSDSYISHPLSSSSHISPWMWKICMHVSATKGQSMTTKRQINKWQHLLSRWLGVRKFIQNDCWKRKRLSKSCSSNFEFEWMKKMTIPWDVGTWAWHLPRGQR